MRRHTISQSSGPEIATAPVFPFWEKANIGSLEFNREIREWPDRVFSYFSSPEMLMRWLSPRASVDFKPGGVFVLSWGTQGRVTGEYVEIIKDRMIKFTWEDTLSSETLVTISFIGFGTKTRLRVVHQLFGGSTKASWNEGHLSEWSFFLDNLCSVIEMGNDMRFSKARENGWGWILGSHFS